MIKSMTGYGGAKGDYEGLNITAELKSVNNRYLDCSVRLPRSYIFAEDMIKSTVSGRISRGKVDVFITLDSSGTDDIVVKVNENLALGYVQALRRISEITGAEYDITASGIARFPEVLTTEKREADREEVAKAICDVLASALDEFDAMRTKEGDKLCEDIMGRLVTIENYVSKVEARSPETVKEYREKLTSRMTEVLSGRDIDEGRILLEAAVYADKVAVDEETVRLRSHIAQMREMLAGGSPVGRKLDFLIQEFNREANTIGSKCTDSDIAKTVVDLKAEIEKIREQIQNIE